MSQVATGPEAPAAPAAPPGSPAPAPSAPQMPQLPEQFVRVPKADPLLAEYGGDWHAMSAAHKQYRQDFSPYADILKFARENQIAPEKLQQLLQFYTQPDPANPNVPAAFDADGFLKKVEEVTGKRVETALEAERTKARQESEQAAQQQKLSEVRRQVTDFANAALKEFGIDEKNPQQRMFRNEFFETLNEDTLEALRKANPGYTDEQLLPYVAQCAPQMLEATKAKLAWIKTARYQTAAQVAQEQQQIPATLGPGPGGKQPPRTDLRPGTPEYREHLLAVGRAAAGG